MTVYYGNRPFLRNAILKEAFGPDADRDPIHRNGDDEWFLCHHSPAAPIQPFDQALATYYVTRTVVKWQEWVLPEYKHRMRVAKCNECGKVWWQDLLVYPL